MGESSEERDSNELILMASGVKIIKNERVNLKCYEMRKTENDKGKGTTKWEAIRSIEIVTVFINGKFVINKLLSESIKRKR